jgi:pimeloyl-ACP methyl ester carboxylesterase
MKFKTADVAGLKIFYREAGDPSKPNIVLHGFPSSSHSFHDLIPRLADRFHVIAPDYPGHGVQRSAGSDRPATDLRRHGRSLRRAHRTVRPRASRLYMHDIGGPIGMRIATAHPERIAGPDFSELYLWSAKSRSQAESQE